MPEEKTISLSFEALRHQAEKLIQKHPEISPDFPLNFLDLIHELKIQHSELHIQNEELKRAQEELLQLQQEYEELYEFAPCGYLTLNSKGIITRANLSAVMLLGKTRTAILSSGFGMFFTQDQYNACLLCQKKAAETGEKQTVELEVNTNRKSPTWVRADITADRDDAGSVKLWRIVLTDITKQYIIEKEKKSIADDLRQTQKMESIGTLAGGIAHEFNNLLYIIMANSEFLLEDVPEGNPARNGLEEILSAGTRAKEIVKQLLTFSRKNDVAKKVMDMGKVVTESLKLIQSSMPKQIDLRLTIAHDTGPVYGNETQISQILINLCSNAKDAMPITGGRIAVHLSCEPLDQDFAHRHPPLTAGPHIKLVVSDNGCGIDPGQLKKIFDPYFTTKEVNKGTGIGLAVVYGIIRNHHGSISVRSQPDEGTEFTIYIPVYDGPSENKIETTMDLPKGHESILFVDDEPSIVELGKKRLRLLGYTVNGSTDPGKALEIFKEDPDRYDLIITDMSMPGMTGDQLVSEISNIRPQIPAILCTGFSEKVSVETAKQLGANAFLMKPISLSEFALTIRKVLDRSGR